MVRWGRRIFLILLTGWGLLLVVRCQLPRQTVATEAARDSTSAVYLVRHGWHAGIAIRRADLPDDQWPVPDDVLDADYVEVGWGEARYYPGHSRGIWGTVRAGAWPTASVVHVVPVADSVSARFDRHTIVRLPVSASALEALTQYVAATFARPDSGTALPAADGYYPDSRFYPSELPYHVFNNCNHWAAGALEAAGCDTAPRWTLTVSQVIRQARDCGSLLQRRPVD